MRCPSYESLACLPEYALCRGRIIVLWRRFWSSQSAHRTVTLANTIASQGESSMSIPVIGASTLCCLFVIVTFAGLVSVPLRSLTYANESGSRLDAGESMSRSTLEAVKKSLK